MARFFREGVILSRAVFPAGRRILRNRRREHDGEIPRPPGESTGLRDDGLITRQSGPAGSVRASLYFASDKRSGRMTERSRT
jgi:hypothetical protein